MEGELPEVRSGHSGLIYENLNGSDCMLIYGGSNGFKVLDCVYRLDIQSIEPFISEWKKLRVRGFKLGCV